MQKDLRDQIVASVTSGTSVAWGTGLRNKGGKRVVIWSISGTGEIALEGASGHEDSRVQVDCWGKTYREVDTLAKQVKTGLNGYRGGKIKGCFWIGRRDNKPEQDLTDNEFSVQLDFNVSYEA